MNQSHHIFDRRQVRRHRERAARTIAAHDFLLREMAARLGERLNEVKRPFDTVLDLGAHHGIMGIPGTVKTDLAFGFRPDVVCDEELIPFAANSFDLVVSCGSLHWVNDLPGTLIQINQILKPGGLFLAMMPGGQTLRELRESFEQAEMRHRGGISPRVSPFIDVKDAGSLLQRAGFAEPVTDSELLTVSYDHPLKLLKDLRGMGESNAMLPRVKSCTPVSIMMAMADHYLRHYSNDKGRIPATFECVTMTAWKGL